MRDDTNIGDVKLTSNPEYRIIQGAPEFKGEGTINGKSFSQIRADLRRDFTGEPFLVISFGPGSIKDTAGLHTNPYKRDSNKAPGFIGRGYIDGQMMRLIAWQNTNHKGMPQLAVKFEDWDGYMVRKDQYRKGADTEPGPRPSFPDLAPQAPAAPPPYQSTFGPAAGQDDIPF